MAKIQTYITIGGVDVTSSCFKWTFTDTYGQEIPEMTLTMSWQVYDTLTPENGDEVIVKRGPTTGQENNVFRGNVDIVNKNKPFVEIICKDKLIALVRKSVNTSFDKDIDPEAGVASELMDTLVTEYGELSTNSGATVVSTGTTVLIEKFVCRKTDIYERVMTLAEIFEYQIYYNYDDDYVYIEPQGYSTNTNNLIVGDNVKNVPKWSFDNSQLCNNIRVEGAEQEVETTESGQIGVAAGYSQTSILLTQSPISTKVFCDAADPPTTLRTGGALGATTTFDYYVDEINNLIVWNTSQYTPGANDFVETRYSYPRPIPVIRKNNASIALYGEASTTKHFSDIKTVEDAINRGDKYLSTYSTPFVKVELHVPEIDNDYRAGEMVRVVDSTNDEDRTLPINKVVRTWPHQFDKISVGNKEWTIAEYNRLTLDKIKRLEEEFSKNQDVLIQIVDLDRTIPYKRRDIKVRKRTAAGTDQFIADHPIYGLVGTAKWGDQDMGAYSWEFVHQGGERYKEYLYDYDYAVDEGDWTVQDDCDSIAWNTAGNAATPSLNYNTYKTGKTSLNLLKTAGGVSAVWEKTLGGTFDGTGKAFRLWIRIRDSAVMNKFSTLGNGLQIRVGSDNANYFHFDNPFGTQELIVGWNLLGFDFATAGTIGAPNVAVLDYLEVRVITENAGDTLTGDELIMDTWLTGDSEAKFNMRNTRIDFEANDIWYSNYIFKGTTFSWATLSVDNPTGTLTYEISADGGSNWQALTLDSRTALTDSDATGVKLRITETGSAPATLENTTGTFGENSSPAIQLFMEV
ncbi:MAG: hypothetical protein Unbinned1693contig1002_42 [Prokaryotic dsDNA virus sp.]|jgi:hypothetical protein|nr:MAG: hypothetical protein Unbinned1693contig1002_42 [Prokaryotic dsDNA virus sp.]|tara:strand:+ start:3921 stop:6317 length:2397 start_codon:yes stop_codon:yes gene_type:complete